MNRIRVELGQVEFTVYNYNNIYFLIIPVRVPIYSYHKQARERSESSRPQKLPSFSPQLFLGKILVYINKSLGNIRDLGTGPPWNYYFVRYYQSPLLLHTLSLASNGSGYCEFFWTWTELQYILKRSRNSPHQIISGHGGIRRRHKKKPFHWSYVQQCIELYLKMGHCTRLTVICWHSRMRNGSLSGGRRWQKSEWVFWGRMRTKWHSLRMRNFC